MHREIFSFSDEDVRMERVAPGNFCRWLRLEFTVTLVAIFLTAGSALRGTVERESPKFEEYASGLSGLEATMKEFCQLSDQPCKVAEQQQLYLVVLPCCAIRGCR